MILKFSSINKYWKYICLLGLGAFCWACSDDNPDGGQNSGEPGYEGGQGTEQEITRSYKLGTLAGFEGEIRKQINTICILLLGLSQI